MNKKQAQKKKCPFVKKSKYNNDILCVTTDCMAWAYEFVYPGRNNAIDENSGYCKRLI